MKSFPVATISVNFRSKVNSLIIAWCVSSEAEFDRFSFQFRQVTASVTDTALSASLVYFLVSSLSLQGVQRTIVI